MNAETLRVAIGGRNALTRWSLVALLPLGILLGTFWGLRNGLTLETWLPVVLGVHLVLIVPFLLCRAIMIRATAEGPRPWLGLGIFAFIGGLRALMLAIAATPLGVTLPSGTVVDVVPNGMGSGIVILGVVAVVVDGSRRNRAVVVQLAALDASFERTRAFDEAALADLEARSVAQIAGMLEQELRQVESEVGNAPERVAARIRNLANDIARPLSHSLAMGQDWISEAEDITTKPPRWERIKDVIAEIRPANPLVPFLLLELIALPTVISEPIGGVGFAASMMLLVGGIMFAFSWVVARLWPKGRTTLLRLTVLIVLYAAIGLVAAWVRTIIIEWQTGIHNPLWIAPFFLILTSMGVSLTAAIQVFQRDDRDRLTMSIARNAQLNVQVRERARRVQRRIAKILHSNVQAELIASASFIAARARGSGGPSAQEEEVSRELQRLTSAIHERLIPSVEPAVPANERIVDLTSLWSGILEVKVEADTHVWTALDNDRSALDAVMDVVAEGLTNAVRHGNGPEMIIDLSVDAVEIVVRLTSTGSLTQSTQPGFGSEILSEATSKWTLEAEGEQIHLTTHIPLVPASV